MRWLNHTLMELWNSFRGEHVPIVLRGHEVRLIRTAFFEGASLMLAELMRAEKHGALKERMEELLRDICAYEALLPDLPRHRAARLRLTRERFERLKLVSNS